MLSARSLLIYLFAEYGAVAGVMTEGARFNLDFFLATTFFLGAAFLTGAFFTGAFWTVVEDFAIVGFFVEAVFGARAIGLEIDCSSLDNILLSAFFLLK
jgi:hypothetical protein